MRHRIAGKKFSRTTNHRKALIRNLGKALIERGSIRTTLPKAKALRPWIEKIITKGRYDSLSTRRHLVKCLGQISVVNKVIDEISPRYQDRPGGYVRIVKSGDRLGDGAPMAWVAWVLG